MNLKKRSEPTTIEERTRLVSWRDKDEIVLQEMYRAS